MKIALGCDHNGVELKLHLMSLLQELGYDCQDLGCYDTNAVDYPDVAQKVAQAVGKSQVDRGVLICGTGIGMSISANKVPGVRAALCYDAFTARRAREHNDANVLCLGSQTTGQDAAREIVKVYLETQFEGGRHARRVEKIRALEGRHLEEQKSTGRAQ
ncbi:MAG: ribose 5-phosphate isomerase B [Chloroflexi bacterium]|nr:ribose 5-phosphate isomerase B [Chloroflexota bacterium]